jgi:hypothetical protein
MAVITGGNPNGGYGRFVQGNSFENIAEAGKTKDGGIFSNFSPNNGNQTTSAGSADPADARRIVSGLSQGGSLISKASLQSPNVQFGSSESSGNDWRVRISINPNSKILYWGAEGSGLLAPLKSTNGFLFPYVPSVTVTHSANYQTQQLTHSNYAQYFYESSSVGSINVAGPFTVQNAAEAQYFLAALYFFRACTKMFYGISADYQGSPPPIVYLDGYGQHYLPHVPCVVTSFSHTMPDDVDYLEVATTQSISTTTTSSTLTGAFGSITLPSVPGTNAGSQISTQSVNSAFNRVPTVSTFSLTLQPIMSRSQAIQFDYKKFAAGGLIVGSGNPFPGGYL